MIVITINVYTRHRHYSRHTIYILNYVYLRQEQTRVLTEYYLGCGDDMYLILGAHKSEFCRGVVDDNRLLPCTDYLI